MPKENIFDKLSKERKEQQESLESALAGEQIQSERDRILVGRPRKRKEATTMTISLDKADKEKIKLYAYSRALTVSDVIHQWIEEKCDEN